MFRQAGGRVREMQEEVAVPGMQEGVRHQVHQEAPEDMQERAGRIRSCQSPEISHQNWDKIK